MSGKALRATRLDTLSLLTKISPSLCRSEKILPKQTKPKNSRWGEDKDLEASKKMTGYHHQERPFNLGTPNSPQCAEKKLQGLLM